MCPETKEAIKVGCSVLLLTAGIYGVIVSLFVAGGIALIYAVKVIWG